MPVLGDMSHTRVNKLSGGFSGHIHPLDANSAPRGGKQAGDSLDQLRLSVSVYSGKAYDLSGTDLEAELLDDLLLGLIADREVIQFQHHFPSLLLRLLHAQCDLTAHHGRGQCLRIAVGQIVDTAGDLSPAENADPVADAHELIEFVADKDNADAILL